MTSEVRRKREQLLEKKRADELAARFESSRILRFHGDDEIPGWIQSEIAQVRKTGSSPQDYISCDVERRELLEWMQSFLQRAGVGVRLHISTGLKSRPWAELEAVSDDWLQEFTEHRGFDLYMISEDLRCLVVFFEEEYHYEAFSANSTMRSTHVPSEP